MVTQVEIMNNIQIC